MTHLQANGFALENSRWRYSTGPPHITDPPDAGGATISADGSKQTIKWLRGVLLAVIAIVPLPLWLKRKMAAVIRRLPDWYLSRWATALNVDLVRFSQDCPDLVHRINSGECKQIIQDYLESHQVILLAHSLRKLVHNIITKYKGDALPLEKETIEQQVAALALAECTGEGKAFASRAGAILSHGGIEEPVLVDYHRALDNQDIGPLEKLQQVLDNIPYGGWIISRLQEAKRWLSGHRELNIRWEIETLPDSGGIYEFLLKGGKR